MTLVRSQLSSERGPCTPPFPLAPQPWVSPAMRGFPSMLCSLARRLLLPVHGPPLRGLGVTTTFASHSRLAARQAHATSSSAPHRPQLRRCLHTASPLPLAANTSRREIHLSHCLASTPTYDGEPAPPRARRSLLCQLPLAVHLSLPFVATGQRAAADTNSDSPYCHARRATLDTIR